MTKIMKCPNCNEILGNSLSRFCPSCGTALDSYQHSSISNRELEYLIEEIQENISDLKKVKARTITNVLVEHIYISFPLLSVLIFLVVYKFTNWIPAGYVSLGTGLGYLNYFLFVDEKFRLKDTFRKKKQTGNSHKDLKADIEKNLQKAKIKYGEKREFKNLIEEFKNETASIDVKNKRVKSIEFGIYAFIILAIIGVFLIPTEPKVSEEEQAIQINKELELIEDEINSYITNEDYENALNSINLLHHPLHVIYEGKGGFFETIYYDEYWDTKRENYKKEVRENQNGNSSQKKIETKTPKKKKESVIEDNWDEYEYEYEYDEEILDENY